ncbi:MAG: hypothetical protein JSR64_01185 [Nitrospira sp.]|nr:hypothetical protein [Nitrospira sp.]
MTELSASNSLMALQAENARLVALLEVHGIEWRLPETVASSEAGGASPVKTTGEKLALFRRLFQGRTDVFPVRWENQSSVSWVGVDGWHQLQGACANNLLCQGAFP